MNYLIALLSIHLLAFTAYLLYRKYNAATTLLAIGSLMTLVSYFLYPEQQLDAEHPNSFILFQLLNNIVYTLKNRILSIGLLIMLLCGYVEYMKQIKASDAFVYIMMQSLSILRKYPHLAAIIVIPIGVLLTIAIPSATGVALLLVATIYPVLLGLGLNKISSITIIIACTIWDIGLNSPCANLAANLLGIDIARYFEYQMEFIIPITFLCMILYSIYSYYINKSYGRDTEYKELQTSNLNWKNTAPLYYAIFPALPLIFSILLSDTFYLGKLGYSMGLESAVVLSMLISVSADMILKKSVRETISQIQVFWKGMGKIFSSVVVLIVAADIFATGLKNIGFMDSIIGIAQSLNIGSAGITTIFSIITFLSTVITGSSTVSFDIYAPIIMDVAAKFHTAPLSLILPVQIITGIGKVISPIAIVVITLSEITGISTFKFIKCNIIPVVIIAITSLITMLYINMITF